VKTITQYREDIRTLMKKSAEIDAKCMVENRDPNMEEINFKNEIMDTVSEYQKIIDTMERQERIASQLEQPIKALTVPSGRIVVGDDRTSKDKFHAFGAQIVAIMNASLPGGHVDPRLRISNAATGLGEAIPSDGGFLIQTDFSAELFKEVFKTAQLASMPRRIPISGNSNATTINGFDETSRATGSRHGGVQVYWIDEAATITPSKPKFRQIELKLKKVAGLVYLTSEMMDDAAVLESECKSAFVTEMGFAIDDVMVNGTGAGQPLGIMNSGSLVTVSKETGQSAATVTAENIMKMRARLFAASRAKSVWLINQNIEPQLHSMSIAIGTGGIPVYMPAGGLSGLPYDTLYGRPVMPIEQCSSLGTIGDIILADFTQGYILADKGGIKAEMSIHVAFLTDQQCFRFILRIDGQPIRATALTPYKGNDTLSHFVALETRS